MKNKKIKYIEPADYFPKNIRKKHKLGEYAEKDKSAKDNAKKQKDVQKFYTSFCCL